VKKFFASLILVTSLPALAATYTISIGSSSSTIQATLDSAGAGSTIFFAPGTYDIGAPLTIPCTANLTLTGPATNPATAILSATFARGSRDILNIDGCTEGTTVQYLALQNTGGIYITTSASNITITSNQFSNLPGGTSQGSSPAIYVDGSETPSNPNAQVLSNTTITWNTFGDNNSCFSPSDVMDSPNDLGGLCAGIMINSTVNGLTIENNWFNHLEEGVHLLCVNGSSNSPCEPPLGTTDRNVTAQFNDFNNIHRIPWEEQPQVSQNIFFRYNTVHDFYRPSHMTFDLSFACCAGGASPGIVATNNVLVENVPAMSGSYMAYGIEAWGVGAQYDNNLVEGLNNAIGVAWGYGGGSWEINDDYVCGPNWAHANNFIADEGYHVTPPPTRNGDLTDGTCATQTSVAPTISQSSTIVTLRDPGTTVGLGPLGNTSIYYTTDGSTPTVNSTLYTAPFSATPGSLVKAIGMWGQGANARSWPAGYGYVPSAVVAATTGGTSTGAPTPTLVGVSLRPAGGASTMVTGSSLQIIAYGTYSDGSAAALPNGTVTGWSSSSGQVASINSGGMVTALSSGTTSLDAMVGSLKAAASTMTVTSAPVSQKTLVQAHLGTPGSANTMLTGGTLQFTAYGVYSDGSTATLPDAQGNAVTAWTSSNPQAASISNSGLAAAGSSGTTNIEAAIGALNASIWTVKVTAAPVSQKTLVRAYLGTSGSANTMLTGGTLQFTAYGIYSDGSTATLPDAQGNAVTAWSSSSSQVASISSEGLATATASGTTNIEAAIGALKASVWTVAVTSTPVSQKTLVRAYLGTPGSANTMLTGGTLQFTAYGVYSDGSTATLPDAQENAVTAWTSSNSQVASITSEGLATATASGTTNIEAAIGSLKASIWTVTVTAAPSPSSGPTAPGSPLGDTFLGPFWKLVSPVGGTASISNAHLFLNVPGGSNHDSLLPSNQAVRVVQAIGNETFDISIKIDSLLVAANDGSKEGLMVVSGAKDYITFEFAADGTNIHLSAETVANGIATTVLDDTGFGQYQSPMYLRLTRTGSAYIAYYSADGSNWVQATSFTDTKIPVSIGPFASNYNTSPSMTDPLVMSVNWFHTQ
jgi:hypothetical protein